MVSFSLAAVVFCAGAALASGDPLARAAAAMAPVKTLQAVVHQQKRLAVFDEVVETKGHIVLARPRRLRLGILYIPLRLCR